MSTLILTCDTGEGHNSCAKAIKEVYNSHGQECEIINPVKFVSEGFSAFVSKVHISMYRNHPNVFRVGYDYVNSHKRFTARGSFPYRILALGVDRLNDYIVKKKIRQIICVHPLLMMMVTELQNRHNPDCEFAFVATDYTCSPGLAESKLDYCFIPDSSLTEEFIQSNIVVSQIVPVGIPVRQQFYKHTDKTVAKKKFGIPGNQLHILMMCGSMGCGPMESVLDLLSKHSGFHITVVCGNNQDLYKSLTEAYSGNSRIHVRGFVMNMSELMDSADLFVTKPGGLSSTEAAVKHLPAVYINTVGGCENCNLRFFTERNCAVAADTVQQVAETCINIIRDMDILKEMTAALNKLPECNAAEEIWKVIQGGSYGN